MHALYKLALALASIFLLSAGGVCIWLFIYTGDLPNTSQLSQFSPGARTLLTDSCLVGPSMAVPFDQIGKSFQNAFVSAEPSLSFSDQIARSLMCSQPHRAGRYHLNAFRLAWHIRRRFSEPQLFTIYANRAYFGAGVTGIEKASEKFCHKDASELNLEEAALLAGVLRGPGYLSPFKYPDRALQRRNAVLETMAARGKLDGAEEARAEATPVISFFSADESLQFPASLSPEILAVLLKTRQAGEGLEFASDRERADPAQLFRATEVHLSSSEGVDLVVLGIPPMSGADNDWFWIVHSSPHSAPRVLLFAGGYSLELLNNRTHGYPDIRSSWSSASETEETTYRFNGKKYKTFKQDYSSKTN